MAKISHMKLVISKSIIMLIAEVRQLAYAKLCLLFFYIGICSILIMVNGCHNTKQVNSSIGKPETDTTAKVYSNMHKVQLLNNSVCIYIPNRWVSQQESLDNGHKILYFIPYKPADNTRHSANATIVTKHIKKEITLKQYSDSILAEVDPQNGSLIVNDEYDGTKWRFVLWRAQDEVPYVVFDRFGLDNNIAVHFRVAYPLMDENNIEPVEQITNEMNQAISSLVILPKK